MYFYYFQIICNDLNLDIYPYSDSFPHTENTIRIEGLLELCGENRDKCIFIFYYK